MKKYEHLNLEYPSGCIIAKCTITDCILIDDEVRKMLKQKNPSVYANIVENQNWNGYGFKLENVKKIKSINAVGKLSFWNYNYKEMKK